MIKSAYFQLWSLLPFPQHGGDVDHQPQLHLYPKPRYAIVHTTNNIIQRRGKNGLVLPHRISLHPLIWLRQYNDHLANSVHHQQEHTRSVNNHKLIPGINCETSDKNNCHKSILVFGSYIVQKWCVVLALHFTFWLGFYFYLDFIDRHRYICTIQVHEISPGGGHVNGRT